MSGPAEPGTLEEKAYMVASVMAAGKERAIKQALDAYFERSDWGESDLEALDSIALNYDHISGTETLVINGRAMVEFGRIECDVNVEGSSVQCTYHQSVKQLAGVCGVKE